MMPLHTKKIFSFNIFATNTVVLMQQVRQVFMLCTNHICLHSPIIFLYIAGLKKTPRLTEKKYQSLYKAINGIILVNTLILLHKICVIYCDTHDPGGVCTYTCTEMTRDWVNSSIYQRAATYFRHKKSPIQELLQ